jgi:hypothetical protein
MIDQIDDPPSPDPAQIQGREAIPSRQVSGNLLGNPQLGKAFAAGILPGLALPRQHEYKTMKNACWKDRAGVFRADSRRIVEREGLIAAAKGE